MPSKIAIFLLSLLGGYAFALSDYTVFVFCLIGVVIFFNTKLFFWEEA